MLPAPFSARSRVHEYGGGAFLVVGGTVYFVNDQDQDIYRLRSRDAPERLTSEAHMRFADMCWDRPRSRLIAVAERHTTADDHAHPDNLIVQISLAPHSFGHVAELVTGNDFFASPTLNPDGRRFAYMAWDLPDMPWDSAALYLGTFDENGGIPSPDRIAGGAEGAVFQPEWADDHKLLFVSDESGLGEYLLFRRWDDAATDKRPSGFQPATLESWDKILRNSRQRIDSRRLCGEGAIPPWAPRSREGAYCSG